MYRRNDAIVVRGKSSTTWRNNTPPTKTKLNPKIKIIQPITIKLWKLILVLIFVISWTIFLLHK